MPHAEASLLGKRTCVLFKDGLYTYIFFFLHFALYRISATKGKTKELVLDSDMQKDLLL